jgi:hypothetical protein
MKVTCKFLPVFANNIVHESFTSHAVLSSISSGSTEKHHFLFGNSSYGVAESRLGDVTMDIEVFNQGVFSIGGFHMASRTNFTVVHHNIALILGLAAIDRFALPKSDRKRLLILLGCAVA